MLSLAGFVQSVVAALQRLGLLESAHPYFPVTGLFGNPGQMGGFQAIAFVSLLLLWKANAHRRWTSALWSAAVAAISYPLIVSASRAAWLGALCGVVVVFGDALFRWLKAHRWAQPVLPVLALAFLTGLYLLRPQSADGRLLIWRVSADMIADRPWTGFGPGGFARNYMHYQAAFFRAHPDSRFAAVAGDVDYPFNDLLRLGVEYGLLGFVLGLALVVAVVCLCRQKERLAPFVAYFVFACFSYPSYKAGLLLCLPLTVLYALNLREPNRVGRLLCVVLSILVFAVQLPEAWHPIGHATCSEWCRLGQEALDKGNLQAAEDYLTEASYMVPTRTRPQYLLWKLALLRSDESRAEAIAARLISGEPKVWDTFTIRARSEVSEWLRDGGGD